MGIPSVLQKILETKAAEIERGRAFVSQAELRDKARDLPPTRGFVRAMEQAVASGPAIIAEVKKASPSAGIIRENFDPASIARSYEEGGATCLSVLTDEEYFKGHRGYLEEARNACALPCLRKDFIVDPWQIEESRCLGADCILLIVAALSDDQLQDLHGRARALEMDVLTEVHDEDELRRALALEDTLLGVNNRNLHDFSTSLDTSLRLKAMLPPDRLLITESGIKTKEDIERMRAADIHAFLVGEAFMREPEPGRALHDLFFRGQ